MNRQARNRRELLLGEAGRLAERLELDAKRARSAWLHGRSNCTAAEARRTTPVRLLWVVTGPLALHTRHGSDTRATTLLTGAAGAAPIRDVSD
jgi:hypothetical protein